MISMPSLAKTASKDGLDGEEVDREQARRLRPQKRTPGEAGTLGRRAKPRLPQELPHRRRRNTDAEAAQFAHDALISPARVLARQSQH
jgi:hypothetical protein